jgi:hypothetical protein
MVNQNCFYDTLDSNLNKTEIRKNVEKKRTTEKKKIDEKITEIAKELRSNFKELNSYSVAVQDHAGTSFYFFVLKLQRSKMSLKPENWLQI